MVTIPRAVWEQLQRDVAALKAARDTTATTAPEPEASGAEVGAAPAAANRNYLSLPDISFILQAKGLLSSDKRDEGRTRLNLSEGELGIQGYVYPGVKADAFIVGAPAENQPFGLEEGYLTFLGVRKGLNINVGRKFAPFGRTGELHNHSWLYPRQLLPIRNLVSSEALVGDGVNFNYLFPTKGSLFVRGSLGFFSGEGTSTRFNLSDRSDPFFGGIPQGTTSGFTRRFINARLWAGHPIGENGELEVGVSRAHGTSEITDESDNNLSGNVTLTGADVSYRRFMTGGKRLLLRSEYFLYQPKGGLPTHRASGYYALANLRLDPYRDVGLLYEKSGFPQAPGRSENALSLILTKQLTEQFYIRLMGTHGDLPAEVTTNCACNSRLDWGRIRTHWSEHLHRRGALQCAPTPNTRHQFQHRVLDLRKKPHEDNTTHLHTKPVSRCRHTHGRWLGTKRTSRHFRSSDVA